MSTTEDQPGPAVEVPYFTNEDLIRLTKLRNEKREIEREIKDIERVVKEAVHAEDMTETTGITIEGESVAQIKVTTSRRLDTQALKETKPEIYEAYLTDVYSRALQVVL